MGYVVKEANLDKDREIMVNILSNNRSVDGFDWNKRFEWIYKNNPFGEAKAWIIWDDKKDLPVGFTGVFPRPVFVNGKEYTAWNCGDFSIEKKYRVLGVALKLRRAAKECIDNNVVPFLYAHPNERMELIHLKAGHKKIALMKRYALPIRATRHVRKIIKHESLAFFMAKPLNLLLSFKYRFSTFLGMSAVLHDSVQISDAHEELNRNMKETFTIVGNRSNEYTKWKYGANPNIKYRQFDMFYKDHLVATIFFIQTKDVVYIADIMIDDFDRYAGQVLRMFINTVRRAFNRSIVSISYVLQEFNPFISVMKKMGFKYRSDATSGVISYCNSEINPELSDTVLDGKNWYMTLGDRDA